MIQLTERKAKAVDSDSLHVVLLNREIFTLLRLYAAAERISVDCAASALLRDALGASQ